MIRCVKISQEFQGSFLLPLLQRSILCASCHSFPTLPTIASVNVLARPSCIYYLVTAMLHSRAVMNSWFSTFVVGAWRVSWRRGLLSKPINLARARLIVMPLPNHFRGMLSTLSQCHDHQSGAPRIMIDEEVELWPWG